MNDRDFLFKQDLNLAAASPVPWTPRDVMWGLGVFLLWIFFFAVVGLLGEELELPIDAGLLVVFGEAVLLLPVVLEYMDS